MLCCESLTTTYSFFLIVTGIAFSLKQAIQQIPYGRYVGQSGSGKQVPAKVAWFVQELPSFLVPLLLLWRSDTDFTMGKVLLCLFCGHYFQRAFVYSMLTKGRPSPMRIMLLALLFCSLNGFFQGHHLLHCAHYDHTWLTDLRLVTGVALFFLGMGINLHSDHILRCLRKPGDFTYNIPKGGMFEYVSGANFLGEIIEWFGFAVAAWSLPAFSFAFFTVCCIGPRAYHHHRFYLETFSDYPRSRKAVIPFIF